MKQEILEYVRHYNGVSFAELSRSIQGFKGEYAMFLGAPETQNIMLWNGMSQEAVDALNELIQEKAILYRGCSLLIYLVDGTFLDYPLVKRRMSYKKPHWWPVVINVNPDYGKVINCDTVA